MGMGVEVRDKIARRAAKEIQNGMIVNLGIGIPSLVPNHLPEDIKMLCGKWNRRHGTNAK